MIQPAQKGIVDDIFLTDALGQRYLSYALSTIVSRSLPDVRDGLKPVHRRLLYAMRQLKLDPSSGFKKCARVVGDVIGKYHPHGDAAVYDALVRLAQEFAVRYPLVEGQGNFGNVDGDNAAAMRYTEARLTHVAEALLEGIDEDSVDFQSTYDGEDEEPVVLPAGFPNLLANGANGIAVGMATSIPPHNVSELCDALRYLIKHPNTSVEKLLEFIPGPDFPTGGVLVEPRQSIVTAYRTGRGNFRLRGRWEVERLTLGAYHVVVTEIPYQVQKSRFIEKVAELLVAHKLPLLADIRDESAETVRIILEPRNRNVQPTTLMEQLFRETELEVRIGLNMNVLDAGNIPQLMNLREVLTDFLSHRHEVLERRNRYRLGKIEKRLEVLSGLLVAYLNLDEVIRIVREEDEPKQVLMHRFEINEIQSYAILSMRLRQLRKLEEIEIKSEYRQLSEERDDITALLGDDRRRWKAISEEIREIGKEYSSVTSLGKRRTTIQDGAPSIVMPVEASIEREPVTVICSAKGWLRVIKGHSADASELRYKEGDGGKFCLRALSTDKLIIFATNGRFFTLGCDRLSGGRGHGEPLRLMIDLPERHEPVAVFVHSAGRRLLIGSDKGRGFLIDEKEVVAQTRNGKQILLLATDEKAAFCAFVDARADSVAVMGSNRKLLIFPLGELPTMVRGRGVMLQRYRQGGLCDATTFSLAEGLSWRVGGGMRTEKDVTPWMGKRGQIGQKAPRGFPLSNKFT